VILLRGEAASRKNTGKNTVPNIINSFQKETQAVEIKEIEQEK